MDLAAYLARVGLSASMPIAPDLATLQRLVHAHVHSIAFENVDVQLGRPIALDMDSLARKLINSRRGGYCFEQNGFFSSLLRELEYDVVTLAARVRWMRAGPSPRTHMLSSVALDGERWLVDVGFGGFVPTVPLRLIADVEQETPLGTFRLTHRADTWTLSARVESGYSDLYAFTEEPHGPVDYEVMNHYTSTHPASRFRTSLVVSRPQDGARHSLLDTEYVVRRSGETIKRAIPPRDVPALLRDVFDLDVPDLVELAVFAHLP